MLNNGTEFIRHFLKNWRKRTAICPVLESKVQADSDRRNIRVFEVGLSFERYGDYEQSTGNAAQEAESSRLIAIAKSKGLYVPKNNWGKYGDRKRLPSGESIIFLSNDGETITKIRNPFAKAAIKSLHAKDIIYEHLVHNILFPTTRYEFVGISEDIDGVRIILQQKYIPRKFSVPTQKEIDCYLLDGLKLHIENKYFYANDNDVSADGDNVLTDGDNLFFIDPIIKFKQPALGVLDYYYKLLN